MIARAVYPPAFFMTAIQAVARLLRLPHLVEILRQGVLRNLYLADCALVTLHVLLQRHEQPFGMLRSEDYAAAHLRLRYRGKYRREIEYELRGRVGYDDQIGVYAHCRFGIEFEVYAHRVVLIVFRHKSKGSFFVICKYKHRCRYFPPDNIENINKISTFSISRGQSRTCSGYAEARKGRKDFNNLTFSVSVMLLRRDKKCAEKTGSEHFFHTFVRI